MQHTEQASESKQATERRRYPFAGVPQGMFHRIRSMNLFDTLTNQHHSHDFNSARSEYIRSRIIILCTLFTLFAPLWIPIDYLIFPEEQISIVVGGRLLLTLVLLGTLYLSHKSRGNLKLTLIALKLLVLSPAIFYLGIMALVEQEASQLIGYSFIPFLLMAFLSVFPLTSMESISIGIPLIAIMILADWFQGNLFTPVGFHDLWQISVLMIIAIWANQSQLHMLLRLYRQATHDPLTGLLNRGVLMERLHTLSKESQNAKKPLPISIMIMDLDRFKRINDTHGHLIGDQVLKTFAKILHAELRTTDVVARYGGEEFVVVLPGTPKEDAVQVAERIRVHCEQCWVSNLNNEPVPFTTSIGVGEVNLQESIESALQRIDNRLYEAKNKGRNCVVGT
ncbi:diguanylate cyclase (GGDEF) domain-containing protein [Allopseudospirillum japonicum]|uniref:diguanylate cyclase n=1 Tax=Allopseudospirillum japonicum TaxID=64971 RepID=A0A1H6T0N1_9GAMM|nr:GGDEF domain-containing protein [Allopseudospirillum japonicum]SEI71674.1 diguanylate cyclase (GGDEF) domain-containing protein [Allopseudospirillum japonicum]